MSLTERASPHVLIAASAGSGKTYQLANRYLNLLVRGESPDRILATTFTRKAAAEILERILAPHLSIAGEVDAKRCRKGEGR